jgi:protein-S-isoprenylcysteine O-methyltransferase Ste14
MSVVSFEQAILVWILVGGIVFPLLFKITAPYGRHASAVGPVLPAWLGWMLMEAPSPLGMLLCFWVGDNRGAATLAFLILWQFHYFNRTILYPLRKTGQQAPMSLLIAGSSIFFNLINAGTNGYYLFVIGPDRGQEWLVDPRFIGGLALFLVGFGINYQSDRILMGLRKPGESGYKIPHGGLYRYLSCPNYFGEIIEWLGWAILTWSLSGLAFAFWTMANLLPRALAHHRWYQQKFPDYPPDRKAIVPFVL